MKKLFSVGFVALTFLLLAKSALAESPSAIRSLRGVTAVRVMVEDLNTAMQKTGLQKEHIAAVAQGILQKRGIHVLQPQDAGRVPLVYIRLSSVVSGEENTAPVGLYLNMQIRQMAMLEKKESMLAKQAASEATEKPLIVSTWENGMMALVARKEIGFYVRTILTNLVEDFARDHTEANGLPTQS